MDHEIEDGGGNSETVKVACDFPFLGVLDFGIVKEKGDAQRFSGLIFDQCRPF